MNSRALWERMVTAPVQADRYRGLSAHECDLYAVNLVEASAKLGVWVHLGGHLAALEERRKEAFREARDGITTKLKGWQFEPDEDASGLYLKCRNAGQRLAIMRLLGWRPETDGEEVRPCPVAEILHSARRPAEGDDPDALVEF